MNIRQIFSWLLSLCALVLLTGLRHLPLYQWLAVLGVTLGVVAYLWGRHLRLVESELASRQRRDGRAATDDRAKAQRNAISNLARDAGYASGDITTVSRRLTKILSSVIQVERASIWLFSACREYLDCIALLDADVEQDISGVKLEVRAFPRYFEALIKDSRIYASDAKRDPRTSELTDIYLNPLNISAMLDAGIVVDGQLVGIICLEHRHGNRRWQPDEEAFASLIATLVAQKMVNIEKIRALDDLELANQHLQHILDAASEISVIATDAHGTITLFNKGAENLLGYTASEMLYQQSPILIHLEAEVIARGKELSEELGEEIEGFEVFVAKARRGSFDEHEWTYVRKDGSHVPVLLTVTAIRNDAGEIVGLLGVGFDMTARHRHQLALELHNRDLGIANEQAKQLIREADQANQAKSEFLASMSHEIRTPMNGVLGMLHLIGRESLLPSQQHYLDLASSSARSLLSVINDILDFSKIDAKKLTLEILEFDLIALLSDVGKSMAVRSQENNVSLILDFVGIQFEQVKGDPHRLRQIVTNLLGNAVKFTLRGEIILRADITEKSGRYWLSVSVLDTGVGVPEDKRASLFAPFSQADSSNTRRFGGTGLGLVISKELVELMGGSIGLESEEGQGSHFYFSVPIDICHQVESPPEVAKPYQVLLVDAAASSRIVVLAELQLLGCKVELADSIAGALAKYGNHVFSLLLIDSDYSSELALLPRGRNSLVYLLTNMGHQGAVPAHCAGYIHRPISRNDLRVALGVDTSKRRIQISTKAELSEGQIVRDARVLLVEDNVINQQVALGLLADLGLIVVMAKDGVEALELIDQAIAPFDLILMDCQMPRMDGFQTTKKIRDMDSPACMTPIIAMTANVMSGDREHCIASGMNDYVAKPIEPALLADRLSYWLTRTTDSVGVEPTEIADEHQRPGQCTEVTSGSGPQESNLKNVSRSLTFDAASGVLDHNASATLQVWNFNAALSRVRGKPNRLVMLIALFKQDMPKRITAIGTELERHHFAEVVQLAHQIKGVAANLSGELLAQVAGILETQAGAELPCRRDIEKTFDELCQSYEGLLSAFDQYVESLSIEDGSDIENKKGSQ